MSPRTLPYLQSCETCLAVPSDVFCPSPLVKVIVNTNANMGSRNAHQYSYKDVIQVTQDMLTLFFKIITQSKMQNL